MAQPVARQRDPVTGTDIHVVMVPSPGGPIPTPTPHPFKGQLLDALEVTVHVNGRPAAVQGSVARNLPPHLPLGGPSFQRPPSNQGVVAAGSATVLVGGKPLARVGDPVTTCNDPVDAPTGTIVGGSPNVVSS